MERRRNRRIALGCEARLIVQGLATPVDAICTEVAVGGLTLHAAYVPRSGERVEVLLDLGVRLRRAGRPAEAFAVLEDARERFPGTPLAGRATLEIAQGFFDDSEFAEAATWFERVGPSGGSAVLGRQNAERARAHGVRQHLERIGLVVLAAWASWVLPRIRWRALSFATVGNALRELTVLLPATGMLVLLGPQTSPAIRHPIYAIGAATAALLAIGNLSLLTNPPGPRGRAVHAGLTVLGIVAISYAVLYRYDLVFALESAVRSPLDG